MRYLLVGLLFLAGCSPSVAPSQSPPVGNSSAPSVAGSASPSPTCSPIGGTAAPCSPDEYARVEAQNKLVNEAIAVYRRWNKESSRLYRVGGTTSVTPEMAATTAGESQKSVLAIFQDARAAGIRATSGAIRIVRIEPHGTTEERGGVALRACIDGSSLTFEKDGKRIGTGSLATEDLVMKPVDGQMKMWSARSWKVKSCTAS